MLKLKMVKSIIIMVTVLLFFSCAPSKLKHIPAPTLSELHIADYGEYPSNYEKIIKDYLHGYLVDPDSIKGLEISEPKAGWTQFHSEYFSDPPEFGYICWVTFNAKNRMGGYVGYRKYLMVLVSPKFSSVMLPSATDLPAVSCSLT